MQRRNFLKSFGIAGAALSVPTVLATTSFYSKQKITHLRLQGRVECNGAGIAGVAVTDGVSIAVTDAAGRYAFASTTASEFVYISLPRGYAVPHQKGIAQFYRRIESGSDVFRADFNLEKLQTDDHKHQFVVWADTQLKEDEDAARLKKEAVPDLVALLKTYPEGALFHGIGCGDLVWDRFQLLDDYKEAVHNTGVPFFNVIGNHDLDLEARSDDLSAVTFRSHFGPTYFSFNRGAIHYVVLDDVFFIGSGRKYIGYLPEAQLHWLEQDLALVKPGSTVVVSLHIPSDTGLARRTKTAEDLSQVVSNRHQLYKMLAPYKVHLLSGHTHVNEKWERDNMIEHVHGTVCGAWWTGPICSDGSPSGYGVYEVTGSDIAWFYKSIGKPKEHQLRIYARGKAAAYPNDVAVNVWNWDEKWKVEWFEDDVPKGAMTQRVALDPWAEELYTGAELPKGRAFVEPMLADHLFFCTPSPEAKSITVKATDRFGNVYRETAPLWRDQVMFQSLFALQDPA